MEPLPPVDESLKQAEEYLIASYRMVGAIGKTLALQSAIECMLKAIRRHLEDTEKKGEDTNAT